MPPAVDPRFAETHEAILAAGQRLFRQKGYQGASLRDIMGAADLTVGGFYAHFDSKAALFKACFDKASEAGAARVMAGAGKGEFLKPVHRYLSEAHVAAKAEGCPVAAMLTEFDRIREETPLPMVDAYITRFGKELARLGADPDRSFALVSMMVGALALARGVTDSKLKDRIISQALASAKTFAAKD
jgi:TetR/AcrR family transcriptional repressor of nem operon